MMKKFLVGLLLIAAMPALSSAAELPENNTAIELVDLDAYSNNCCEPRRCFPRERCCPREERVRDNFTWVVSDATGPGVGFRVPPGEFIPFNIQAGSVLPEGFVLTPPFVKYIGKKPGIFEVLFSINVIPQTASDIILVVGGVAIRDSDSETGSLQNHSKAIVRIAPGATIAVRNDSTVPTPGGDILLTAGANGRSASMIITQIK